MGDAARGRPGRQGQLVVHEQGVITLHGDS